MQDNGYSYAASRTPMTHDMLPKSKHFSTQYKEAGEGEPLVGACSPDALLLGGNMAMVDPGHIE